VPAQGRGNTCKGRSAQSSNCESALAQVRTSGRRRASGAAERKEAAQRARRLCRRRRLARTAASVFPTRASATASPWTAWLRKWQARGGRCAPGVGKARPFALLRAWRRTHAAAAPWRRRRRPPSSPCDWALTQSARPGLHAEETGAGASAGGRAGSGVRAGSNGRRGEGRGRGGAPRTAARRVSTRAAIVQKPHRHSARGGRVSSWHAAARTRRRAGKRQREPFRRQVAQRLQLGERFLRRRRCARNSRHCGRKKNPEERIHAKK